MSINLVIPERCWGLVRHSWSTRLTSILNRLTCLQEQTRQNNQVEYLGRGIYHCNVCNCRFENLYNNTLEQHCSGRKHQKNLQVAGLSEDITFLRILKNADVSSQLQHKYHRIYSFLHLHSEGIECELIKKAKLKLGSTFYEISSSVYSHHHEKSVDDLNFSNLEEILQNVFLKKAVELITLSYAKRKIASEYDSVENLRAQVAILESIQGCDNSSETGKSNRSLVKWFGKFIKSSAGGGELYLILKANLTKYLILEQSIRKNLS